MMLQLNDNGVVTSVDEENLIYVDEKDNICLDEVINVIDDKLAFLYGAKGDLINEDSYRLGQISFAITVLNELKKELKGDDGND